MRYPLKIDSPTLQVRHIAQGVVGVEMELVILDAEGREMIVWPFKMEPGELFNVLLRSLEVEVNLETMRF